MNNVTNANEKLETLFDMRLCAKTSEEITFIDSEIRTAQQELAAVNGVQGILDRFDARHSEAVNADADAFENVREGADWNDWPQ